MAWRWAAFMLVGTVSTSPWWEAAKEHDVDALLLKRASSECPSSYTTTTGLDFKTHCNTNQVGWDLLADGTGVTFTTQESSMEDCMDRCASERPLCYGIAFDYQDGTCWFKNDTFTYQSQSANVDNTTNLAVADRTELAPYSTACQYQNGSVQDNNGLEFTIHCNQDIVGADYCAWNSLDCLLHATSLQDCMDQCTKSQPLCQAVAYNPDMQHGYGNCYPKYDLAEGFVTTGKTIGDGAITHSAVARLPDIPFDCTSNQVIASADGTGYTLSCNQDRPGNDITQYHSDKLEDCITSCSQWSDGGTCIAVIFDTDMTNGFQNCYLKGGVGTPVTIDKQGFILALQGGTPTTSSSSSAGPASTGSSDSGNKNNGGSSNEGGGSGLSGGAIAGIVVGAVAGLALLAALLLLLLLLLRRRNSKERQSQMGAPDPASAGIAETQEAQQPYLHGSYGQIDHKYTPQNDDRPGNLEAGWQPHQQDTPGSAVSCAHGNGAQGAYEMENQPRLELPAHQTERTELPGASPHVL